MLQAFTSFCSLYMLDLITTLFNVESLTLIPFSLQQTYVFTTRSFTHVLQPRLTYTLDSKYLITNKKGKMT